MFITGCALIAQYSDGLWNRGMVTEVNRSDGLICVLFVDYGETCLIDPKQHNCHKMALMFEQVPIQVLRCKLENIVPKGQLISECLLGVIDFPKNQQKI